MRHVSGEINGQHSGVPIVMIHFLRWAIARHAVAIATLLLAFFNTASVPAQQPAVIDWKLESTAPWQPRDSQAEYVFADRQWIAGGWFDSFAAPPRDVWSSRDGVQWELVTPAAPWLHSDLPMNLTFDGKMWMMGGWYNGRLPGHSASNQVWSSSDGKQWEQATAAAPWSPRLAAIYRSVSPWLQNVRITYPLRIQNPGCHPPHRRNRLPLSRPKIKDE